MQLREPRRQTYSDKWQNTVAVDSLRCTLRDDDAPTAAAVRALAAGRWESSAAAGVR